MSKGKLIGGNIIYPSNFMFIESDGNWVSNPTDNQLASDGFKDIVYIESESIDIRFDENEDNIIIYTHSQSDTDAEIQHDNEV